MTFPKRPDHWALIVSDVERRQQHKGLIRSWVRFLGIVVGALIAVFLLFVGLVETVAEILWRKNG